MSGRNLLVHPIWSQQELGHPIPPSPHAVSVALPQWRDVVGYEESDPRVMSRLTSGYPRFVIQKLIQQTVEAVFPGKLALPFPTVATARLCVEYIHQSTKAPTEIRSQAGLHFVHTTEAGRPGLRAFWQHTGLIVSTRQAEAWLGGQEDNPATEAKQSLREQLAALYACDADDVFLTATGMAAQFSALRAVMARCPGLPTAQLGFPYVDTLKLQQKLGTGGILLHDLSTLERDLEQLLERHALAACFSEIPGNPLLGCANLSRVTPLLRNHRLPLVADEVVATPVNVDLSNHADLVATSLTKFMAGTGDVMGGALICNPRSPLYSELKPLVSSQHEDMLWSGDALVLEKQMRTFPQRMEIHNRNGLLLAERLRQHPAIERVWYPKWEFSEAYDAVRRPNGGWSALITFLPKNAAETSSRIFDALEVSKGPSLGTVFTLACPFTLLAHYSELDWAESCGVSRHLIRVSAGLESPDSLWERFERALQPS